MNFLSKFRKKSEMKNKPKENEPKKGEAIPSDKSPFRFFGRTKQKEGEAPSAPAKKPVGEEGNKTERAESFLGKFLPTIIFSALAFFIPFFIGILFRPLFLVGLIAGAAFCGLYILGALIPSFGRAELKWFGMVVKVIIIIVVLGSIIWAVWFFTSTKMGKAATAQSTLGGGALGEAVESFTPQINILKQVMTGTYDPSQLYASEQYKDEYAVVKNPGVFLEDVRPLMDEFSCPGGSCDAVIIGRVHAQSISLKSKDRIKNLHLSAEDSEGNALDCAPASLGPGIKIIQPFRCTKSYANLLELAPENIRIDLLYTFKAKAGKQIYVADENMLQAIYAEGKEPLDFLGISRDEVASWQTKGPAGLGIGIATKEDIISANKQNSTGGCISAENVPHYLGFTVQNNGAGDMVMTSLKVTLPDTGEVVVYTTNLPGGRVSGGYARKQLGSSDMFVREYALDDAKGYVEPGTFKTYYMTLFVCQGFLNGQTHNSFFVLADLDYTYTETASASFTVNPI